VHHLPLKEPGSIAGSIRQLIINGTEIRVRDGMPCLTDLWRAGGSEENKDPYQWSRRDGADFIDFIKENSKRLNKPIYQVDRGRGGATWACESCSWPMPNISATNSMLT
jgi:hypothetical protein